VEYDPKTTTVNIYGICKEDLYLEDNKIVSRSGLLRPETQSQDTPFLHQSEKLLAFRSKRFTKEEVHELARQAGMTVKDIAHEN